MCAGIDRSFGNFNLMIQYIGQWVPDFTAMPELMLFDSDEFPVPDSSQYYLIPGILNEQISGFNRLIYGQTHRISHTVAGRPSVSLLHNTLNAEIYCMYNISTEELMLMPKVSYNITDNQTAVVRMSSFAGCVILLQMDMEPIMQMTCRDRNRLALQSDLLSAWVLGIKNVLALTGDLPSLGDHPQAKPVYDLDSVELLWAIGRLNQGYDMVGAELKGKSDLFPGASSKPRG
jgi:hypothetical protein